jgi:hypothetical protein
MNAIIRNVGSEENVLVIDLARLIAGTSDTSKLYYDAMHVTDAGSQVYAKHISTQFMGLFGESSAN